jgi:threonine/homoserine/homoserine lactone efflux protein
MLLHLVLGFALGALSSLVPGPCGLAVMTAASRRGLARTLAIAAGGGLGDGTYATLGLVGIAPLVAHHPIVPAVLQAASGLALLAFGLARLARRSPLTHAAHAVQTRTDDATPPRARDIATGLVVGLGTVIANPGALLSWTAVVGALLTGATALDAAAIAIGIAAGSAAWLALLGVLARRRPTSRGDLLHRIGAAVAILLLLSGAVALVRAATLVW